MIDNSAIMEPYLHAMMAREDFEGLTVDNLKFLATTVIVPYDKENDEEDSSEA